MYTCKKVDNGGYDMKFRVEKEIFDKLPQACFGVVMAKGIDNSKIYPEYKNLYAACIPHLLIGVEKYAELTIESTESIKRY